MTIAFDHKTPLYLQVAQMILDAVAAGDLAEGEPIPSVRTVSVEQGLNPQTVLNATSLLIQDGILEKRRGIGIYVCPGARQQVLKAEREKFERKDIPGLVNRARVLGLSRAKTLELVKSQFSHKKLDSKGTGG